MVICPRSEYFADACRPGNQVSIRLRGLHLDAAADMPKEAEDVVTFEGDNPAIVHQMLASFYSPNYDDEFHPTQRPYEFNAGVYALADNYRIKFIKDIARHKVLKLWHDFLPQGVEDLVNAIKVF